MAKSTISAGLLLYRFEAEELRFFLVHPGGPYFARKDEGAWTVPKGEPEPGEAELQAARREFEEETGYRPDGHFIPLSPVTQKGGKTVKCWAVAGDLDPETLVSNTFELEWPPGSGKKESYPEIDRGGWFGIAEARVKINERQAPLLDELAGILASR